MSKAVKDDAFLPYILHFCSMSKYYFIFYIIPSSPFLQQPCCKSPVQYFLQVCSFPHLHYILPHLSLVLHPAAVRQPCCCSCPGLSRVKHTAHSSFSGQNYGSPWETRYCHSTQSSSQLWCGMPGLGLTFLGLQQLNKINSH